MAAQILPWAVTGRSSKLSFSTVLVMLATLCPSVTARGRTWRKAKPVAISESPLPTRLHSIRVSCGSLGAQARGVCPSRACRSSLRCCRRRMHAEALLREDVDCEQCHGCSGSVLLGVGRGTEYDFVRKLVMSEKIKCASQLVRCMTRASRRGEENLQVPVCLGPFPFNCFT